MSAAVSPILEIRNLRKRFGGLQVIDDLSLTIRRGELRCIIGPNGAGKSTLFNLISGAIKPDAGCIVFDGEDITGRPVSEIAARGIVRKFQVTSVFDTLSVEHNLIVAITPRQPRTRLLFERSRVTGPERLEEVERVLQTIGLADRRRELAGNLSHGERQWLEIGMVLLAQPRLVLLDEPTAGMTSAETDRTAELVREIARTNTVVVIDHDMQFVHDIAQTITVLHQGRVLREGTLEEIENDASVRDVYLGRQ